MRLTVKIGLLGLAFAATLSVGAPALAKAPPQHQTAHQTRSEPVLAELLRRARSGDVTAYEPLATHYLDAKGGQRDIVAAVRWLNAGVKAGDTDCMIDLGNLYYEGQDLDRDDGKALQLYTAAADHGDALGAYNAGLVYEVAREDLSQAVVWYRRAADGGDEGGMYKLALAYQLGQGVATDQAQAVAWMKKAALAGSSDAMNDLGAYYAEGNGVEADPVMALRLYMAAAELGSAVAMSNVAGAYHDGEGVTADFQKALAWYGQAASAGDQEAYFHLGQMFEDGEGVKANAARAVKFYRMAAGSDDDDVAQAAEDAIERLESGSSETPIA